MAMKYRLRSIRSKSRINDPTMWVFIAYFVLFVLASKVSPNIFAALLFGWFLSMIIEVPARALSRLKFIPYKIAIVFSGIVIFAVLVVGFSALVPILVEEGTRVIRLIAGAATNLDIEGLLDLENEEIEEQILQVINTSLSKITGSISELGGNVLNWLVQRAPAASTTILIFVIAASYFTALIPAIRRNLWRFFPASGRKKAIEFLGGFYGDLRHFIRGQIIIATLVGGSVGVGMFIAGIQYSFFLGFLAGITNFIPYLGLIVSAVPALLLGLSNGGTWGLIKVLIVLVVTNQMETWIFAPRIQGKRMQLNWFLIIISILFFAQVFGLVGVLIAIPLLVFIRKFWIVYVQEAFRTL